MKTIMVTGAGGLIGSAITHQLAAEKRFKIVAVSSGRRPIEYPESVFPETADLLSEEEQIALLERVQPDTIIHLAWNLNGPGFLESVSNIQWLEASFSLLRHFNGKDFLFAGSSSEYGEGIFCSEQDECHPVSLYGDCKLAFERVATRYCAQSGIRFVGMRLFSVYGPGDRRPGRALPTAFASFLEGMPFVCKGPNNAWDYIFTDDIGNAVVKIMDSNYSGTVNVSSGKAVTMREVFTSVATIIGCEELLSFENTELPGRKLVGDNRVLKETIGFFQFTPMEEGLKKTAAYMQEAFKKL